MRNRTSTANRSRLVRRLVAGLALLAISAPPGCSEKETGGGGGKPGTSTGGRAATGGSMAGVQATPIPPGDPNDPEVMRRQVRWQIVRAAQVDKQVLKLVGTGGKRPRSGDFPAANLGALLLTLDPLRADSPCRAELDGELRLGPPAKLAAAFRDGPDAGRASPIHDADIRDLSFERRDDVLEGAVQVSVPDAIEARIGFAARLRDGAWQVERLSFSVWGAECWLKEGVWSHFGPACNETLRFDLPEVPFVDPAPNMPDRVTVYATASDAPGDASAREVQVTIGGNSTPLSDPAEIGAILEKVFKKREREAEQATVSIRVDRRLSVASLGPLLRAVRQAGPAKFVLVVRHAEELREVPFEPVFDAEPDGAKTAPDAPLVRIDAREGGEIAAIQINSTPAPPPVGGDYPAAFAWLGSVRQIELRTDPRLNLANFASALAELARPAKSTDIKRRVLLVLDAPFSELGIEPANPGKPETKTHTSLDGGARK